MKKIIFILTFIGGFLLTEVSCTKEKIVERIVYQDTSSKRLFLLEFVALEQTSTKSRVILTFKDLDATVNTSYDNTMFNVNTATVLGTSSVGVSKSVFDSVNVNDYYRNTTISRPSNDTIKVIFRIGTMGDVDIKTEP